jgi:hypothetical protein
VTCLGLGTDTKLRHGCEDAQALRAGALITALGGLRARRERRPAMATTIPTLTPKEPRERLHELLSLTREIAGAQALLRAKAAELKGSDWETDRFANVVSGELRGVYELLVMNPPDDLLDVDDLAERLEDTIGVLDLAIEGDDA